MAERFVAGYTVASGALSGLVGARTLQGADLLRGVDEDFVEDLTATLDLEEEELISLLDEIFSGELQEEHASEYLRVLELILVARCNKLESELELVLTYYLPNDTSGRWNPVLAALGMSTLAKQFGETTLAFPWKHVSNVIWPGVMAFTPAKLRVLRVELDGDWRGRLQALPVGLLINADSDWDPAECRTELEEGLSTLSTWVDVALSRNEGLILWMDGDQ
ncbi:MAG: hypothetical protein JRH20_00905 [Deltaproteobacteria bacterium]|nr:hypothetical protein [Deltaproteobacteria bacterium]